MTITLQDARISLQNAMPEDVKITLLPNGNLQIEVPHYGNNGQTTPGNENRWVKFADEMQRTSPLCGKSEQVVALIREFRNEGTFKD
jgi:hypothetical protein